VDKLTLAALEATLRGPAPPTWLALRADPADLRVRVERLRDALTDLDAEVTRAAAVVGGGGAPGVGLDSWAVSLPQGFAVALRTGEPPVLGRIERGRLLLDLRCVPPELDEVVVGAVRRAAAVTEAAPDSEAAESPCT
jgi:L-seryl-tRNA(Ser) seleniumtransferase